MNLETTKGMLFCHMKIQLLHILLGASTTVSCSMPSNYLVCHSPQTSILHIYKTSVLDYDMRGYKINVAMAEKTAPKAPPAYGHGY